MKMPIKLLISGWFGTRNIGDEAILVSEVSSIKYEIPSADITVFSQGVNNENIKELGIRQVSNRLKDIRGIIREIKKCDVLILGGGGLFQDTTSIYNIVFHMYKVVLALLFRKKVFIYAVGVEPLRWRINRVFLKYILPMVDRITVRDSLSKELLLSINPDLSKKIMVTIDPAVSLSAKRINITTEETKRIGIAIREWANPFPFLPSSISERLSFLPGKRKNNRKKLINKYAELIDSLSDNGYEVYLIPMEGCRDEAFQLEVERCCKASPIIEEWSPSVYEMIQKICSMDIVIGMRFHSIVLSSICGNKIVSLDYSKKVSSFMSMLVLDNNRFTLGFNVREIVDKVLDQSSADDITYTDQLDELRIVEKENINHLIKIL